MPQYLNPKAVEYYDLAIQAYQKKDFSLAEAHASKAIELDTDYTMAFMLRGGIRRVTKNYQAAIVDLQQAIRLDPEAKSVPAAYVLIAQIKLELNHENKEEVIALINLAVNKEETIRPSIKDSRVTGYYLLYKMLAKLKYELNDYEGAYNAGKAALLPGSEKGENNDTLRLIADAAYQLKDGTALMWLTTYIELLLEQDPTSSLLPEYYLKRAEIHFRHENYQAACEDAQAAVSYDQSYKQKTNSMIAKCSFALEREAFNRRKGKSLPSLGELAKFTFLANTKATELKVTAALKDCGINQDVADFIKEEKDKETMSATSPKMRLG